MKLRIVEEKNGFETKIYVQQKGYLLWLIPYWYFHTNPNHDEHFGTSFASIQEAQTYIDDYKRRASVPKTTTIFDV